MTPGTVVKVPFDIDRLATASSRPPHQYRYHDEMIQRSGYVMAALNP